MIPITIDASEWAETYNINQFELATFTDNVISELAVEFGRYWDKQADVLGSSRVQYKQSIFSEKISDKVYEVGLKGWLPNAIENGVSGFDQKEFFEKSSKAKKTATGGWYLTIPFRYGVPTSVATSSVFTGVMPSEVYLEAKKLKKKEGLDVRNLPKEFQIKGVREKVITKSKTFEEYTHKTAKFEGLVRKPDNLNRGTYNTFRRVGSGSDDNSWIHTGIKARNLAEKALDVMNVPNIVDKLAEKYMKTLVL